MASDRRRFGSLRRLPSGRWQGRYIGPNGRRYAAPTTFATKTDAARWLTAEEAAIMQGAWLDPSRSGVKLEEYATAWIVQRTVKGRPLATRTRETYEHSLRSWIVPHIGQTPIGRLTPDLIRTWAREGVGYRPYHCSPTGVRIPARGPKRGS